MVEAIRPARDLDLLDAVDAFARVPLAAEVWRVALDGRDPALGRASLSRWCDGTFDVLSTASDRDGAIAEIHALLSLQPVFPAKIPWFAHRLKVSAAQTLKLADLPTLARLGVDTTRYADRDYRRTQPIANAAFFLGFDGLIVPSARRRGLNLVVFTERLAPQQVEVASRESDAIDWEDWRRRTKG